MRSTITIALGLALLASSAYAQTSSNTPTPLTPIVGKTCKGYWEFGHSSIYEGADGAIWFEPSANGGFPYWYKNGKVAKENWKTAPLSEYREASIAATAAEGRGLVISAKGSNGTQFHLTPKTAMTFDLEVTSKSGSGPFHGKVECQ